MLKSMTKKRARKHLFQVAAIAGAIAVSGCGTTDGDRAVSGGLIGAGAGAAIGSLSGDAGTGALIGGLAGAAAGALTSPCMINLGDPWWRQNGGSEKEYRERCVERERNTK